MAAAELVSRMGMSLDGIDDVRIAVEEAFVFVCAHSGGEGEVSFEFNISGEAFDVVAAASGHCDEDSDDETGTRYARFILESVCDEFDIGADGDKCLIHLVKRLS
jgi:serine/threonine-protein kinase RsbW